MSEPIKRFITGMQFEDNLAKRKYVRDWANQKSRQLLLPWGQQKGFVEKKNKSKYTNGSNINKHLNT